MYKSRVSKSIIAGLCLVALLASRPASGQLDQVLNTNNNNNNDVEVISNSVKDLANQQQQQPPVVSRVRNLFQDMMSVNVPIFYDMVRNGSSMGINVLSGLVKVERGEEAERSGLVGDGARRPLSVRVFGIPVFERGNRVRPLESGPALGGLGNLIPSLSNGNNRPPAGPTRPDEVDLPL